MKAENIPIIMYHTVNRHPERHPLGKLALSPKAFRLHLRCLRDCGFRMVSMSDLWQAAVAGDLGRQRLAVLTFDDGFLDNHLIAADILRQFSARATCFVNPAMASNGPPRTLDDEPDAWGLLNFAEMRQMERDGAFDIQSHTLTHEFTFRSDRVIDFYTPDKFDRYYWLVWRLRPETMTDWSGDVRRFASAIPTGYPVFEFGRTLAAPRFEPTDDFVAEAIRRFALEGRVCIDALNGLAGRGTFESPADYVARVDRLLVEPRRILHDKLGKQADFLCFPGGAYDEHVLDRAARAGYLAYMRSSADQTGDNFAVLRPLADRPLTGPMIGLKRISFTKNYPRLLPPAVATYCNVRLKVGMFMGWPASRLGMRIAQAVRKLVRRGE